MQRSLIKIAALGASLAVLVSCNNNPKIEVTSLELKAPPIDSGGPPPPPPPPPARTDGVSLGDLNKDGIIDTIYITQPVLAGDMECKDSTCTTYFAFADDAFPSFSHQMALGGAIGNAGDLDDDGICEIYFVPDWFTSNWTGLNIYSLKNNHWKKIASRDIRRDEGIVEDSLYMPYDKRIVKHNKDYFELVGNVMDDEGIEKLVPKKYYFK
jgi:hypothetical protein